MASRGTEVDRVELEFPRLDLREVQDVVDDGHERVTGRFDDPEILPLFRRELAVQHEIGHPDDAIHRRPNLVTHVRQELALGLVGGFRGLFGGSQFGLRPLAIRGVADDAQEPDRHTVGVAVDAALCTNPMKRPVGPADPALETECASPRALPQRHAEPWADPQGRHTPEDSCVPHSG